jgi:hypothetical protein
MASKNQMTGMLGVYLVAAELTQRGFIVSPTSRSAKGADLLVTDQECNRAWSVQVKTQRNAASFWLLSKDAKRFKSTTHAYVFVNLRGEQRPDYLVVKSALVAKHMRIRHRKTGSTWYLFFRRSVRKKKSEGWELFGDAHPGGLH